MASVRRLDRPAHDHFVLLQHWPDMSVEADVEQRPGVVGRMSSRPEAFSVGCPIERRYPGPSRYRNRSRIEVAERSELDGRHLWSRVRPLFVRSNDGLAVWRKAPVIRRIVGTFDCQLRNLASRSLHGIKIEESFS